MSTWHRFLVLLGGQHGSQNPPKMIQNRWKIDVQVDVFFVCLQDRIFEVFGPNMAQMGLQEGPQEWDTNGLLEAILGLLGLLGPKRPDFYRFFIDFGSILEGFWAPRSSNLEPKWPTDSHTWISYITIVSHASVQNAVPANWQKSTQPYWKGQQDCIFKACQLCIQFSWHN